MSEDPRSSSRPGRTDNGATVEPHRGPRALRRRVAPLDVVVAGGGVAALETLLALRVLAGRRVTARLLAPEPELLYRPPTVAEPFDRGEARRLDLEEIAADQGAQLVAAALTGVNVGDHLAHTSAGQQVPFDILVVATGATAAEPFPGALTFRGRPDVTAMRDLLAGLVAGTSRKVVFALPSEATWPLPLYELALMTAAHVSAHGADAEIVLATPEEAPLALFGPRASAALTSLLAERRIAVRTLSRPVRADAGELLLAGGGRMSADRVVTLPTLHGPRLTGLPCDARGFLPVDRHGCVRGTTDVYAAGDVTAFPLKQGGLAAQQADAVAEAIAARAGAPVDPRPFRPVVRGLLLTGSAPLYLRAEPDRLGVHATVATEAGPRIGRDVAGASSASARPLWWPPGKVAGRFLAPYLATARPIPLGSSPLTDRPAGRIAVRDEEEHRAALDLALLLADADARWGDYQSALRALEAAEALEGVLPPEYEHKRARWLAESRG